MEKDKHMEALTIHHAQDIETIEQRKDKEIADLQEQITTTYKDMSAEIEIL